MSSAVSSSFCSNCGVQIIQPARFCSSCGSAVIKADPTAPEPRVADVAPNGTFIPPPPPPPNQSGVRHPLPEHCHLWNPTAAFCLSFLFTPVFGAILVGKNWTQLDQKDRDFLSYIWAGGITVGIFIFSANEDLRPFFPYAYLGSLGAWFFFDAWPQITIVRNRYGNSYGKQSWASPIWAAIVWMFILRAIFGGK